MNKKIFEITYSDRVYAKNVKEAKQIFIDTFMLIKDDDLTREEFIKVKLERDR